MINNFLNEAPINYSDINNYVRVGPHYYIKEFGTYEVDGQKKDYVKNLLPWQAAAIKEDVNPKEYKKIQRLLSFENIPLHYNYKNVVGNYWNLYKPLKYSPKQGSWKHIEFFLKQVFKEQYEMGLDHCTSLYNNPSQSLPILVLLSKENGTGKTLFLNLLSWLINENMEIIGSDLFMSMFNTFWANKTVVGIEEASLNGKKQYDYLKFLTTAKKVPYHGKGKDAISITNMLHFVICSNDETEFLKIDDEDSRLWVLKLDKVKHFIPNLEEKIKAEIPAFAHFLMNREIEYTKQHEEHRLLFQPEHFKTQQLEILKDESKPEVVKVVKEFVYDYFHHHPEVQKIIYTPGDLKTSLDIRGTNHRISKLILKHMKGAKKLDYPKNTNNTILNSLDFIENARRGHPIEFLRQDFYKPKNETKSNWVSPLPPAQQEKQQTQTQTQKTTTQKTTTQKTTTDNTDNTKKDNTPTRSQITNSKRKAKRRKRR